MATRNVSRTSAGGTKTRRGSGARSGTPVSPPLLDLHATLWERLTKSQRELWSREHPITAKAAENEKRRAVR